MKWPVCEDVLHQPGGPSKVSPTTFKTLNISLNIETSIPAKKKVTNLCRPHWHKLPLPHRCFWLLCKKYFPPVVKSQEVRLVTGDHVGGLSAALGTKKKNLYVRHLFFRLCNRRPFDLWVSHVKLRTRQGLDLRQALAVCRCHEAAYHRKSETGSPPDLLSEWTRRPEHIPPALIAGDTNTADCVTRRKTRNPPKRSRAEAKLFFFLHRAPRTGEGRGWWHDWAADYLIYHQTGK